MKIWKTPEILRLSRIEKWAKARFERRLQGKDTAAAVHAANFYTTIHERANGIAMRDVGSYRD
ncbi:MAG TPA: hypothetical protein VHV56_06430 [Pseudolabrys sp.]|jgi:hypothetical protein|nr:hypothetical protein [Pseudolabrys sp.]